MEIEEASGFQSDGSSAEPGVLIGPSRYGRDRCKRSRGCWLNYKEQYYVKPIHYIKFNIKRSFSTNALPWAIADVSISRRLQVWLQWCLWTVVGVTSSIIRRDIWVLVEIVRNLNNYGISISGQVNFSFVIQLGRVMACKTASSTTTSIHSAGLVLSIG